MGGRQVLPLHPEAIREKTTTPRMPVRPAPIPLPQLESEYPREDEATWLPEVEGRSFTLFEAVKKSSGGERKKEK